MAFNKHKLLINSLHLPSLIVRRFSINPIPPLPQCLPNAWTGHPPSNYGANSMARCFHGALLPPELSKNVVTLTCDSTAERGVCHVYLVGTKHYSKDSSQKVEAVVDFVKPQGLFFGLCRYRPSYLTGSLDYWCESLEIKLDMHKNVLKKFCYWFIVNFVPGVQFPAAFDAQKYVKALKLADRPTELKYKRTRREMPLLDKIKLPLAPLLVFRGPEFLNARDEDFEFDKFNPQIQILSKHFPTAIETILHESDR